MRDFERFSHKITWASGYSTNMKLECLKIPEAYLFTALVLTILRLQKYRSVIHCPVYNVEKRQLVSDEKDFPCDQFH